MSFPGTLKPHKFQKVARAAPLRTPPQGGTPPLKSPRCVRFSPQVRQKLLFFYCFLYSSIWLNFTIIILTLFAQVMVSKASDTNYDA